MADLRTINDGGPAFPAKRTEQVGMLSDHGIVEEGSQQDAATFGEVGYPGMSLRDWFAGQALAGMLADPNVRAQPAQVAEVSYNYADAMLAAREGRSNG